MIFLYILAFDLILSAMITFLLFRMWDKKLTKDKK